MLLTVVLIVAFIVLLYLCNDHKVNAWFDAQALKRANKRAKKTNATLSQLQVARAQKAAAKERERDLIRDRVRIYRSIENAAKEGRNSVNTGYYSFPDELQEELRSKGYTIEGRSVRW